MEVAEVVEPLVEGVEDTTVADTAVEATTVVDTLLEVVTVADIEVAVGEATLRTSDIRLILTLSLSHEKPRIVRLCWRYRGAILEFGEECTMVG